MEIAIVASWVAWSITNALIAKRRGNAELGAFAASVLLSPLLVYLYLLATPAPIEEQRTQALLRALVGKQ